VPYFFLTSTKLDQNLSCEKLLSQSHAEKERIPALRIFDSKLLLALDLIQ
jgi:hypothetical protein